jgi:hypothetical protein
MNKKLYDWQDPPVALAWLQPHLAHCVSERQACFGKHEPPGLGKDLPAHSSASPLCRFSLPQIPPACGEATHVTLHAPWICVTAEEAPHPVRGSGKPGHPVPQRETRAECGWPGTMLPLRPQQSPQKASDPQELCVLAPLHRALGKRMVPRLETLRQSPHRCSPLSSFCSAFMSLAIWKSPS